MHKTNLADQATSSVGGLQVRFTTSGSTDGNVWHVSNGVLSGSGTSNQWYCIQADQIDFAKNVELSVNVECTGTPCPLGGGFRSTAWFYQISTANMFNDINYLVSPFADPVATNVPNESGVNGGWAPQACFGSPWSNAPADGYVNSGNVALDAAFLKADSEGFSANWETLSFAGVDVNPGVGIEGLRLYDVPITAGANPPEVYPTISTWVPRGSALSTTALWATLRADVDALAHQFVLCFSTTQGSVWQANGNAIAAPQDWTIPCNLGCYPDEDCKLANLPTGGFDMEGYAVNWDGRAVLGTYVTVLFANTVGTGQSFVNPGHSIAFAWGHKPSAATAFAPSLLLGVLALAAATLA